MSKNDYGPGKLSLLWLIFIFKFCGPIPGLDRVGDDVGGKEHIQCQVL